MEQRISREEILAKARELATSIASSEEAEFFRKAEEKIEKSEHVQQLIKAIKKKQKEIVGFEALGNGSMAKRIEQEIAVLQEELDNIPLVREYQQMQVDMNELLQSTIGAVKDTVSARIELERDK
ncbi:RicAFT regulatory complex protein RicA family protein [Gorillibacterium sp. sgz500922]|uniref:RicAFT regulatory complex protein RicA family protein n=1 Tax=Gorillibacterium sp. sgz500922 TaxID=3446694 RepID=UPI003F677627